MIGGGAIGTLTPGGSTARTVGSVITDEVSFSIDFDTDASEFGATKVDGGPVEFKIDFDATVHSLIEGRDYRVVITDLAGNRYSELVTASLGDMSWELNGPGSLEFGMGQDDPAAGTVHALTREVEVWKGDSLLWSGPIVRPLASAQFASFQAQTPEWYFSRRHVGKADRTNHVPGGDFEGGYGEWNVGFSAPLEPVAGRNPAHWNDAIVTTRAVTGKRSLRLEQEASGQPKYGITASEYFEWEVDPDTVGEAGDVWTLSAYCFIPSSGWRGPRLDRGGLGMGRFSTSDVIVITSEDGLTFGVFPKPIEGATTTIDELHPRNRWVRHQVTLVQPPSDEPELISVRLHCPNGVIFWDRVTLTLQEALHFEETDQALIAAGIVEHLQDPAYGKSDLGIALHTPLTGVKRDRTYLHQEHAKGLDLLQEFPKLDDGFDWDVQVTPGGKTFRTHYPRKGVDRSASMVFEYGRNIVDFSDAFDGEAAASSVIMLGTGDGSSREEGFAEDPTLFEGITYEDVSVAPDSEGYGQIDTLDNRATERLREASTASIVEIEVKEIVDFEGREVILLGTLQTGDLVRVRIHRGITHVEGVYRVVRMSLNPTSGIITLTLNWWSE